MRKYKIIALLLVLTGCINLDEELFNKIAPENFYNSIDDVFAATARTYQHTSWALKLNSSWWNTSELSSDAMAITQKGVHWYNGGVFVALHGHSWDFMLNQFYTVWRGMYQGVGYAYSNYNDLEYVIKPNAGKFGFTVADIERMQSEMLVLAAMFHMYILEAFGPKAPVFTHDMPNSTRPNAGKGTELFDFIENTFIDNIGKLGNHNAGTKDEFYGRIDQATAAAFLARLYLNASVTIGQDKFSECATYCQKILDGEYGNYSLDKDWQLQFSHNNHKSTAIIWAFPCEKSQLSGLTTPTDVNHYQTKRFFRSDRGGGSNGSHLQPSQTADGQFFMDKYDQGSPYQKYYDGDERRVPMYIRDNGQRQGIFLIGTMNVPEAEYSGMPAFADATEEWKLQTGKDTLYFVDRVGRFSEVANKWREESDARYDELLNAHNFKYLLENAEQGELASVSSDFSNPGIGITKGEENTGFRLNKYPVNPDAFEEGEGNWYSDLAVVRLAEIYYMLAECKLRDGDTPGAAKLLDDVRQEYFTQIGADEAATRQAKFDAGDIDDLREPPHSYSAATTETGDISTYWNAAKYDGGTITLDLDEMLDEWGREFIGEGRRRMDLRRFNKFTKGKWWNKNVETDVKAELFPIPQRALNTNDNLEQNDGY